MLISDRIAAIKNLSYDPGMMQRFALNTLAEVTDGTIDIVDASNPFVFSLETSAVNTAYFLQHNKTLNRKQYPESASTTGDLYLHMSDKDYVDRFALPSYTYFTIVLHKDELLNSMIADPVTNIKKITIPRNSEFIIAGHTFSLQYPIDIRQMRHGGIQIVYDTDILSPLYSIDSNVIDYDEINAADGSSLIKFKFLVHQFNIITVNNDVNTAAGFVTSVAFDDQFYYCRVYLMNNNNQWVEMPTTHTDQIYDSTKPTAVLTVLDNVLQVTIPSVYTYNGLVRGKLRVDCYQTKGNSSLVMNNYKLNDFSAKWLNIDDNDATEYSTAINNIKNILMYSDVNTNGGRNALTMEELRVRVINNAIGPKNIPITSIQLESNITDAGYSVVKNVDTITNRIFLATKEMPEPINSSLISAAGSSMSRVTTTISDLLLANGVINTNNRIIITDDALYKNDNGIIRLVSKEDYSKITKLSNMKKTEYLNNNNLLYSPFHYVLDVNNNTFSSRPYSLNNPVIEMKSYVDSNPVTEFQVNISSEFMIEKTYNGYKLTLKTKSNDAFKALDSSKLYCQLCYKAKGQYIYSYLLGKEVLIDPRDDERVYEFELLSSFDINEDDQISQDSFRYSSENLSTYSDLVQVMDVLFITTDSSMSSFNNIESDTLMGKFQVPSTSKVITHEQLRINFGQALKNLWSRTKTVSTEVMYSKYEEDVFATYLEDTYEIDPVTGSGFKVGADGKLVYNRLAKKGEFILDSEGNKILKFPKGSTVLDADGLPVIITNNNNHVTRYIDILTIEAVYKFATSQSSKEYCTLISNTLVNWITEDIPSFNLNLLDQTKIYFYPKVTQGWVSCYVGNSNIMNISAKQSFKIDLYVPKNTYDNKSLLHELELITKGVIKEQLKNKTLAISNIQDELKDLYGNDVTGIKVYGFDNKYEVLTLLDQTSKFSIRKRLVVLPNNDLVVEEDVEFNYIVI